MDVHWTDDGRSINQVSIGVPSPTSLSDKKQNVDPAVDFFSGTCIRLHVERERPSSQLMSVNSIK